MATAATGASQEADWRSTLGRVGLSARGVMYVVIGYLALSAAFGSSGTGQATSGGVFRWLKSQGGGDVMIWVLALGLVAYALWQLTRAIWGDPVTGSETSDRVMYAGKAVAYGAVAASAVSAAMSSGGGGGGGNQQTAGMLLGLPGGVFITGLVGIGIVAYGAKQLKENGLDAEFMRKLSPDRMVDRDVVEKAGRAGYAARGVTLGMIGVFFVIAAVQHDPQEAKGLGGALATLQQQSYGTWLLALVGLGLGLFGVYCLFEAKMRRDHQD